MLASSTAWIETLNRWGESHVAFAAAMLVQSTILLAVLAGLDVLLLRRTRAAVRDAIWSLLLIKLLLPASLASPFGLVRVLPPMPVAASFDERPAPVDRPVLPRRLAVEVADSTGALAATERIPVKASPANSVATAPSDHLHAPAASSSTVFETAPAIRRATRPNWQALLLMLWAGGALILAGVAVRNSLLIRRIVGRSIPAPPELRALFVESAECAGVSASALRVRVSEDLGSPAICVFWSGTVLLPLAVLNSLDRQQLRFVLVHELVHWRRWLEPRGLSPRRDAPRDVPVST